jgi:hypothetical protein
MILARAAAAKRYKKCCLAKEEAVVREQLAKAEARRAERAAETAAAYRLHLRQVKAAIAASLSGAEHADEDELTIASNAAAELVRAGKLDEAEQPPAISAAVPRRARWLRSPRHGL